MKISKSGIEFIRKWEGCELKPYEDAANKWTVGVGHLIRDGEWDQYKDGITQQEADELLKKDLKWVENTIDRYVKIQLDQDQYDALCSFIFNVGQSAFFKSTLLKWINEPKPAAEIPKQIVRWNRAAGKPLLGLARRRVAESALYLK